MTGREEQERTGINSLASDYVESDLEESEDLVWDHSCLLLGTGLVPRMSTALFLLSLQLKDVSPWSSPKEELAPILSMQRLSPTHCLWGKVS